MNPISNTSSSLYSSSSSGSSSSTNSAYSSTGKKRKISNDPCDSLHKRIKTVADNFHEQIPYSQYESPITMIEAITSLPIGCVEEIVEYSDENHASMVKTSILQKIEMSVRILFPRELLEIIYQYYNNPDLFQRIAKTADQFYSTRPTISSRTIQNDSYIRKHIIETVNTDEFQDDQETWLVETTKSLSKTHSNDVSEYQLKLQARQFIVTYLMFSDSDIFKKTPELQYNIKFFKNVAYPIFFPDGEVFPVSNLVQLVVNVHQEWMKKNPTNRMHAIENAHTNLRKIIQEARLIAIKEKNWHGYTHEYNGFSSYC